MDHSQYGDEQPSSDNLFDNVVHTIQTDVKAVEDWFVHEFGPQEPAFVLPPILMPHTDTPSASDPAADPATASVIGDPNDDVAFWHQQESPESCAVASQGMLIAQLTGQTPSESDLANIAEQNGWYTVDGGTPCDDVGNLLKVYGLNVEQHNNATLEDLSAQLMQKHGVIVGVSGEQIVEAAFPGSPLAIQIEDAQANALLTNSGTIPGQNADHAVEVIGIDRSDPNNPVVILNDPGVPAGAGERVPLDAFMKAWTTSGNFMVDAW